MKGKSILIAVLLGIIFLAVSCGTMNINLNPKQAAAWMNNIYSAQYDEYLTWFDIVGHDERNKPIYKLKANVSEEQIRILNTKKRIFASLEPLLIDYSAYAASGIKTPLIDQVAEEATKLVQQLIDMEGG